MVYFQTKNSNLGKLWRPLVWKILVYFMALWNILLPFGIIFGNLIQFVVIWCVFSRFGKFGPRNIWQALYEPYQTYMASAQISAT
jgi:hypothetical protein